MRRFSAIPMVVVSVLVLVPPADGAEGGAVPSVGEGPSACIPADRCCQVCSGGRACGNSCIQARKTCHKGRGCACNASEVCTTPPSGENKPSDDSKRGPHGDAQIGGASVSVPIPRADRIIAGLRPKFRECYERGLKSEPKMAGKLVITVKVAPDGTVSSAEGSSSTGLSTEVVSCVERATAAAKFEGPGGSGSELRIPVTFVPQSK